MNFNQEVGILQVCTAEKEVLLVQPQPIHGKVIEAPFYGYLFGNTEDRGEQSAPVQTLEVAQYQGSSVLVIATTVIHRVQRLLTPKTYELPDEEKMKFREKVNDFDHPEMRIHVIPELRLKMTKINEELFEKILTNARRRA